MGFDEVRTEEEAKLLEDALKQKDGDALLLIFADWCGHCTTYKPMWKKLAAMAKAKQANNVLTAAVHFDQKDNIPALKNAKLEGYPTVIRVKEDGSVETVSSADMRDEEKMKALLQLESGQQKKPASRRAPKTVQAGLIIGQNGGLRRRKSLRPPVSRKQRRTRRRNTRRARRF